MKRERGRVTLCRTSIQWGTAALLAFPRFPMYSRLNTGSQHLFHRMSRGKVRSTLL